jgi:hypothetical protein
MSKPFDPTKPVQTRDGRPARIICTDSKCKCSGVPQPIVAEVQENNGSKVIITTHNETGHLWPDCMPSGGDLVNIPVKHTGTIWINFYPGPYGYVFNSKQFADECAGGDRIACKEVTIEFTEGEGLE